MARSQGGGGKTFALLLLLALGAGAGGWNYQRNVEAENEKPRPYKAYSDEQLEQLYAAYGGQVETLSGRYDAGSGQRSRSDKVQLLGDAVEQFHRRLHLFDANGQFGGDAAEDRFGHGRHSG